MTLPAYEVIRFAWLFIGSKLEMRLSELKSVVLALEDCVFVMAQVMGCQIDRAAGLVIDLVRAVVEMGLAILLNSLLLLSRALFDFLSISDSTRLGQFLRRIVFDRSIAHHDANVACRGFRRPLLLDFLPLWGVCERS